MHKRADTIGCVWLAHCINSLYNQICCRWRGLNSHIGTPLSTQSRTAFRLRILLMTALPLCYICIGSHRWSKFHPSALLVCSEPSKNQERRCQNEKTSFHNAHYIISLIFEFVNIRKDYLPNVTQTFNADAKNQ